jgi:hypothetical protein
MKTDERTGILILLHFHTKLYLKSNPNKPFCIEKNLYRLAPSSLQAGIQQERKSQNTTRIETSIFVE